MERHSIKEYREKLAKTRIKIFSSNEEHSHSDSCFIFKRNQKAGFYLLSLRFSVLSLADCMWHCTALALLVHCLNEFSQAARAFTSTTSENLPAIYLNTAETLLQKPLGAVLFLAKACNSAILQLYFCFQLKRKKKKRHSSHLNSSKRKKPKETLCNGSDPVIWLEESQHAYRALKDCSVFLSAFRCADTITDYTTSHKYGSGYENSIRLKSWAVVR